VIEVPEREVEHGWFFDDYAYGEGWYPLGAVREGDWYATKADTERWRRDARRREKAREQLGGFGFRGAS
jgi:hypothetical protein